MFLQTCVKNSVYGGVYPSMHQAGGAVADTPPGQTPHRQTPPWADTPWEDTPPPADSPPTATIAGSTHTTGMHSCFNYYFEEVHNFQLTE